MVNKTVNMITAGVIGGLALGGLGGAFLFPNVVDNEVIVEKQVIEYVDVVKTEFVQVPVEVIKTVLVDNGNLDLVLDHVYDNDGKVNYLLDELDDDEVNLIADRIVFINDIKKLSVDAIKEELFDELDGETFVGVKFDEDDMERLKIDDNDDEIEVLEVDFEDSDAELLVTGRFEQDDVKYDFEATVEFRDGEFDDLKDIDVKLH